MIISVPRPTGQYLAVLCDGTHCAESGPEAITEERAVRKALNEGWTIDADGVAMCGACQSEGSGA